MDCIKRTHVYKQNTGYSLALDVYMPESAGNSLPAVMFIHGGALIFGGREMIEENEMTAIVSEGMAYVSIDYRLAPETKLMDIKEDVEDALRWMREDGARLYGFDPGRISVLGKSAGGYLALLCGTFQNKPTAIISFYGYGDILGDWYSRPSPHYLTHPLVAQDDAEQCVRSGVPTNAGFVERWPLYLFSRQTGSWAALVSGHDPIEEKDALSPYCPILNVDAHFPPTLLLHGSVDTDVPVEQSKEMYAALTGAGIEANLLIFPGADHGFDSIWRNIPEEFGIVTHFLKETQRG